MATYAFAGAVAETPGYGQKHKIRFGETWVAGENWRIDFTSTLLGDFTLGKGNIAGQTFYCVGKLRDRLYLGFSSIFALSEVGDPTKWEEQDPGAATITYLSQFGAQDSVTAFGVFEGKLVVFGRQSIQVWQVNADPAQFALLQTLDNSGTRAPLTVKAIGDLDVYYLDDTGFRSIKSKELSGGAYISDAGVAIDEIVKDAQLGYDSSLACGVVEPLTKQYWGFVNGTIYVLSNYPSSKVVAWSTFKPEYTSVVSPTTGASYQANGQAGYTIETGFTYIWIKGANDTNFSDGITTLTKTGTLVAGATTAIGTGTALASVTALLFKVNTFTPSKFVVFGGQVYARGRDRLIYRYGGSDNNSYDYVKLTAELPWLDFSSSSMWKQLTAIDAAFVGRWQIETGTNPKTTAYVQAVERGSSSSPNMATDSTFDVGRFSASGKGKHIKVKATSFTNAAAKLGKLNIIYNNAGED